MAELLTPSDDILEFLDSRRWGHGFIPLTHSDVGRWRRCVRALRRQLPGDHKPNGVSARRADLGALPSADAAAQQRQPGVGSVEETGRRSTDPVCTENLIRVDDVTESLKLAE